MPTGFSPVAIMVAPNGGRRLKADHPAIPLSPAELGRCASDCLDAGAAMMHVHVRRSDGTHLLDADAYGAAIAAIRAEVGDRLVVQITSEALGVYSPAEQIAVVKAVKPEAASLALREVAPDAAAEPAFLDLLGWMARERVVPQIILYAPEEAVRLAALRDAGKLPWDDIPVLYVLGRYTVDQKSAPADLLPFLDAGMPGFAHWSVCAFGQREAACVTTGALLGGHMRVGFENNLQLPDGSVATSNAELVDTVAALARGAGLKLANAAALRDMWTI
ncbi:MAG: 3-keto-5-aminohexanoate cleavage protein [Rhizobiaceae bacterium]|nr:3-keto-5-aminohexanoate cleavage protein [Rhizobiaceae bacterium]